MYMTGSQHLLGKSSVRGGAEGCDHLAHALAGTLARDAVWKDLPLRLDEALVHEADVRLHRERIDVSLHRVRRIWGDLHWREGRRAAGGCRTAGRGDGRRHTGGDELELHVHVRHWHLPTELRLVALTVDDVDHEAGGAEVPADGRHRSSTTGAG